MYLLCRMNSRRTTVHINIRIQVHVHLSSLLCDMPVVVLVCDTKYTDDDATFHEIRSWMTKCKKYRFKIIWFKGLSHQFEMGDK
jgi:hypothetical protein